MVSISTLYEESKSVLVGPMQGKDDAKCQLFRFSLVVGALFDVGLC
jgi:hypothetical protein